jgi:transglutaminase-like putative cysteine protease
VSPNGAPTRPRSILARIKEINTPKSVEDSVLVRCMVTACVMLSVWIAYSQAAIGAEDLVIGEVGTAIGSVYAYAFRRRASIPLKVLLAAASTYAMVRSTEGILAAARIGNLPSLIQPLASLFTWVSAIHSFDTPARKDLLYSVAGAAMLVMAASATATGSDFLLQLAVFALLASATLVASYWAATGKRASLPSLLRQSAASLGMASLAFLGAALVVPAPQPLQGIKLPASLNLKVLLGNPTTFYDSGALSDQQAREALPGRDATRIGGYIGFARELNTAIRAAFSNEVIMRVRTTRPDFLVAETYDRFDGQSWSQSPFHPHSIAGPSPFYIPTPPDQVPGSPSNEAIETVYVQRSLPNLILYEENPVEVIYPGVLLAAGPGSSILTPLAMEKGTIYTVISYLTRASPEELRAAFAPGQPPTYGLSKTQAADYLSTPKDYPAVKRLAESITKGAPTVYDKVAAIEDWMRRHLRYSLDIPPLAPGQDAVETLLFDQRVGYCEQFSTALAIMLRTIGIPAREAVGYLPVSYNPFTGLYEIRPRDAHAWVQVWYGPRYGWQNTDPTTDVPNANPTAAGVLLSYLGSSLRHNEPAWIGAASGALLAIAILVGHRRLPRLARLRRPVPRTLAKLRRLALKQGARRPETLTVEELVAAAIPSSAPENPLLAKSAARLTGLLNRAIYDDEAKEGELGEEILRAFAELRRAAREKAAARQ